MGASALDLAVAFLARGITTAQEATPPAQAVQAMLAAQEGVLGAVVALVWVAIPAEAVEVTAISPHRAAHRRAPAQAHRETAAAI